MSLIYSYFHYAIIILLLLLPPILLISENYLEWINKNKHIYSGIELYTKPIGVKYIRYTLWIFVALATIPPFYEFDVFDFNDFLKSPSAILVCFAISWIYLIIFEFIIFPYSLINQYKKILPKIYEDNNRNAFAYYCLFNHMKGRDPSFLKEEFTNKYSFVSLSSNDEYDRPDTSKIRELIDRELTEIELQALENKAHKIDELIVSIMGYHAKTLEGHYSPERVRLDDELRKYRKEFFKLKLEKVDESESHLPLNISIEKFHDNDLMRNEIISQRILGIKRGKEPSLYQKKYVDIFLNKWTTKQRDIFYVKDQALQAELIPVVSYFKRYLPIVLISGLIFIFHIVDMLPDAIEPLFEIIRSFMANIYLSVIPYIIGGIMLPGNILGIPVVLIGLISLAVFYLCTFEYLLRKLDFRGRLIAVRAASVAVLVYWVSSVWTAIKIFVVPTEFFVTRHLRTFVDSLDQFMREFSSKNWIAAKIFNDSGSIDALKSVLLGLADALSAIGGALLVAPSIILWTLLAYKLITALLFSEEAKLAYLGLLKVPRL